MTYPNDPNDPNAQRPETRRMEPYAPDPHATGHYQVDPEAGAYSQTGYQYPETGQYPATGQYGYDEEQPKPKGDGSKTALLVVIVVLAAALLIGLIAALFFLSSGDDGGDGAAVSSSSSAAPSSSTTSSETPSSSTSSEAPSPTQAPGLVTYHLTGQGNVVGIRYGTDSGERVVATAGAPWTSSSRLSPGDTASLTAIVVSGQVTCNILVGQEIIGTATSGPGPLNCSAIVPDEE